MEPAQVVDRSVDPDPFLNRLVEGLPGTVAAVDRQMRLLLANAQWRKFNRAPWPQSAGLSLYDVAPETAQWRGAFERCLRGEVVKAERVRMTTPSGRSASFQASILPWTNGEGRIGGLLLVTHPLSGEDSDEAVLAARRLEDAVALAGIHVWEMNHSTRQVSGWGATDTFFEGGVGYDQLAQAGQLAVVHPDDQDRVQALWDAQTAAGLDRRAEFRLNRADQLTWVASSSRQIVDEASGAHRVLGVLQDITDRKLAELAAAQANAAKSQFLATMSHEIRTPLSGVLGMAQAMAADPLSPPQRQRLEIVRQSGEALLAMLNDVLDLAKIEAGKLELEEIDFDLETLFLGALAPFSASAAEKGVALEIAPDPVQGVFRGDPGRLRQIIYNLVSNALKFTAKGSVTLRSRADENGLRISVTDTGLGIPGETLDALFEDFRQADAATARQFGGTGLGLSICRRLAHAMGGEIQVQSQRGQGSTFTVRVPMFKIAETDEGAQADATGRAELRPNLRILAADDNRVNRLVLDTLLQQAGLKPTLVEDGAAAIAAWEGGAWDLVLMDVQMPGVDGIAATKAIRAREVQTGRARTPIIALTANAMSHQVSQYLAAGMDGHLSKPIEIARLFEVLQGVEVAADGA